LTVLTVDERNMSMEHCWNDEMEKPKYSGNTLSECYCVYHKSLTLAYEENCTSTV